MRATRRSEDGAVMILFAVLLGAGVLMGLLTIVADVGQAYVARRDAQNVADLVATSMAYQCITNPALCTSPTQARAAAVALAAANATGKRIYASVTEVCGPQTVPCAPLSTSRYDCRATSSTQYIRVRTVGSSARGEGIVPLLFAPLVGGSDRVSVSGCAQVTWGQVSTAPIRIPLVFSICNLVPGDSASIKEWDGTTLTTPCEPDSGFGLAAGAYTATFRGFVLAKRKAGETQFATDCSTSIQVRVGDVLQREASTVCGKALKNQLDLMLGVPALVPVARAAVGGSGDITVASFSQFRLKGYNIADVRNGDTPIGGWPDACSKGSSSSGANCIFGNFSPVVVPYQPVSSSVANLGAQTVIALP